MTDEIVQYRLKKERYCLLIERVLERYILDGGDDEGDPYCEAWLAYMCEVCELDFQQIKAKAQEKYDI